MRDVERATHISSGHLSLIESGHVKNPSPTILHRLAFAYKVDPEALLVLAGYLQPRDKRAKQQAVDHVALASVKGLDEDDLAKVQTFIRFLRAERGRAKG